MVTIGRSLTLSIAALVVSSSVTSAQQSLGGVARQEEARRKEVKTSGKVYTNDSLRADSGLTPSLPAPAPVASAATPAQPAGAATAPQPSASAPAAKPADGTQAAASAGAKDEAYWKKRLVDARAGVDRSKTLAEAMQSRINALNADFSARSDPAQRAQIAADRQRALTELERLRKEIDEGAKTIVTIQEEARKSGVPAGWVR